MEGEKKIKKKKISWDWDNKTKDNHDKQVETRTNRTTKNTARGGPKEDLVDKKKQN